MALRALGPNWSSDDYSDDEYTPSRLPLLNHQAQPPAYVIGNPRFAPKNEAWNVTVSTQTQTPYPFSFSWKGYNITKVLFAVILDHSQTKK